MLDPHEPGDRLVSRALAGYQFLAAQARRQQRQLQRRLQQGKGLTHSQALAAAVTAEVANATISLMNRKRLTQRFQRELCESAVGVRRPLLTVRRV